MRQGTLKQLIEDKLDAGWNNVPWQHPDGHPQAFKFVELPPGTVLPCVCRVASKGGFSPGDLTGFEAVVDGSSLDPDTTIVSVNVEGKVRHNHCGTMIPVSVPPQLIGKCMSTFENKIVAALGPNPKWRKHARRRYRGAFVDVTIHNWFHRVGKRKHPECPLDSEKPVAVRIYHPRGKLVDGDRPPGRCICLRCGEMIAIYTGENGV